MNKVFFRKPDKVKKRMAEDAEKLLRSAESLYWDEMKKPEDERDEQLCSECLKLIEQSSAQLGKYSEKSSFSAYRALRWTAAAVAAVFVLAFISAGVAYAMGVNLWERFFTRTDTGIQIEGRNDMNSASSVDFDAIPDCDQQNISSLDEAFSKFNIKTLDFDLTKQGYMIDNIYITKNDTMLEVYAEYLSADGYVDLSIQCFNGMSNTAYVSELIGDFSEYNVFDVDGTDVYAANDGRDSYICFAYGEFVYQLNSNVQTDVLMQYAEEAISARP